MAKKTGPRIKIMLVSTGKNKAGRSTGYFKTTYKNTRNTEAKLNIKKFDPRAWNKTLDKKGMYVTFKEKKIPK